MTKDEKNIIAEWNKRNTINKDFSRAAFNDLCDLGAEVDPSGTRYCCIESALKQVFAYGTEDDIDAAIHKYATYCKKLGKFESMVDLIGQL